MRSLAALLAFAALSGCGEKGDNAPGPGGVTVGEARALDEAAEMIEARGLPSGPAMSLPSPAASPQGPQAD
jgi:hypothetical protein